MQRILHDNLETLKKLLPYLLVSTLIAFPLFGNLDTLSIRLWDEARNAENAFEMSQSGNWLITTYNKSPDMWNTKPPLLIWTQAVFIRLIGVGELAIRLPSAIAAFLTCITLLLLGVKYLKNNMLAIIAVLILITTNGYVSEHCTRTGDFDALLTLFTTGSLISFFLFLEEKQPRFLYLFFITLSLGVLTKSVAALLILPTIAIYTIWQKQTISLLKNKHFYIALCLFLIPVISFYLLREHYNPGYLKAVQENELGGRYLKTLEDHKEDGWFYYNKILNVDMEVWYLFIPCGLLIGICAKDERIKRIAMFSAIFIITFLIVISMGKTKLGWYTVPIFPFLSLLAALFLDFIYKALENLSYFKSVLKYNIAPVVFLFLILIKPYQHIIQKTYRPKEAPELVEFNELSYFLRDAIKKKKNVNNYNLLFDDYRHITLNFYKKVLESKKINIFYKDYKTLKPEDLVATSQAHIKDYIVNNYIELGILKINKK
jgi:4-amino-4-deoxy-L-arabinose transferase-like glycosyltransferase